MVTLIWRQILLFVLIKLSLGGSEEGYEDWQVETRPNQEFEVSRGVVGHKKDAWDFTLPEKYSSTSSISTAPIKVRKKKKKMIPKRKHPSTPKNFKKKPLKKPKKIIKRKIVSRNSSDGVELNRKPLDIIVHIKMKK